MIESGCIVTFKLDIEQGICNPYVISLKTSTTQSPLAEVK